MGLFGLLKKGLKTMEKIKILMGLFRKNGLYPSFDVITEGVNEPICKIRNDRYLMFCSNNYLGLTENKKVKKAGKKAIDKYGVGPGGARVISGNVDIIEQLEVEISKLTATEDCLTFPTGYMANVAVFNAMLNSLMFDLPYKKEDSIVFSDEYNHGSIIDGIKLSGAQKKIFRHNDFKDLEGKIKESIKYMNKLVVTEGVFSLEGEIVDLPSLLAITKRYNAKLMIDDAHGIGVIGNNGGGSVDYHNCSKQVDILMGCMDKAFGGTGGFLCGSKDLIDYLRVASRSSLLSSALPTGMAGAMIESVRLIREMNDSRSKLFNLSKYLREELLMRGFTILGKDNIPAIPLLLGDEKKGIEFSNLLFKKKIYCPVVRAPAVPMGKSRLRIIIMITHEKQHIDYLINACEEVGKQLKII